jgi:hypothetical protein
MVEFLQIKIIGEYNNGDSPSYYSKFILFPEGSVTVVVTVVMPTSLYTNHVVAKAQDLSHVRFGAA